MVLQQMTDTDLELRVVQAATQIQRWRDFVAHVCAYLVMNTLFIGLWALQGRGFFWPALTLLGWGLGLSFQHFQVVLRGQITDVQVRRYLAERTH